MKPETDKDLVAAFNAEIETQPNAIVAAVSPKERACREERQKQIQAHAVKVMSAGHTYPYAITAALSYGALPYRGPADPRVIEERSLHDYQSNLLRRLGFEATMPVTVQQMWKAARSVGFAPKEFGSMSPVDLWEVLEAKATVLERLRGRDYGEVQEVLKETLSIKGGRPTGTPVDGKKLKDLRMQCNTSQDGLAATCKVSLDSISRGEGGGRWSNDVFKRVAGGLTSILNWRVTPEDLKK